MSMDLQSVTQSEVSQKEKNKDHLSIWNLEKWFWWNYLQGRKGDAEGENGLVATGGGRGWDEQREWSWHVYITVCKMDGQWEAAAYHRELSSVLRDGLAGWDEGVGGRPAREGLHI